jgi:ribosomal protein S18 acetylase RimI-like enzyme
LIFVFRLLYSARPTPEIRDLFWRKGKAMRYLFLIKNYFLIKKEVLSALSFSVVLTFQYYQPSLIEPLYHCFLQAFLEMDRPIPLSLFDFSARMKDKLGLNPHLSGLMFEENEMVGFVLHAHGECHGKQVVYNGGSGVIPSYRGQGIIKRIYQSLLPTLVDTGSKKVLLEVTTDNLQALRIYESLGFKKKQLYHNFKGTINAISMIQNLRFYESQDFKLERFKDFCDFLPPFIDANDRISANWKYERLMEIYHQELVVGFVIFQKHLGRISQIAVRKNMRRKGIGTLLLLQAQRICQRELTLMNISEKAISVIDFLKSIGFKKYMDQYEMERPL